MRIVIMFLVLAICATAAAPALSATLNEAGDDETITNESFTPKAGSVTTLERSSLSNTKYVDDVAVFDDGNDRVFEPDDYQWFERNGTIKTVTGGQLDGATSATVTYSYQQTTERQRGFASMFSQIPRVMGLALPALALLTALIFFRGA